jgi:TolB-like protein/Tfp pilus assembly protein PilF
MTPSRDPAEDSEGLDLGQIGLIREHLRQVLSSPEFAASKRAQEFLQLLIEHALADRTESLKERMIGAEMFGRPVDYDTANDAVVRVKATDVRRRLAQYYGTVTNPVVRIELPVGSYVPKFVWSTAEELSGEPEGLATEKPESQDAELERSGRARTSLRKWTVLAAVAVFLIAMGFFAVESWKKPLAAEPIRSIAILPLINLSGDPSQEYFADGMTEELIAELGKVPTLRVISRTSVMTYKGAKKKLPEIARELRVDGIVEGSIIREGNRVRITAQLIDSRSDEHVWADSYERDMIGVLELQSEVARAVTNEIRIELTPQQQAHFNRVRRFEPEAVEAYLQGTQQMNSGNPRDAIAYFRQAIEKDPDFATAHAALSTAYGWMGEAGWMPYAEAFSEQKAEALRAIELDDSRPEPHLELGVVAVNQDLAWGVQKKEFQRALELNMNSAAVHWAYANHLSRLGMVNDALDHANLALRIDPASSHAYVNMGLIYYYARHYDKALGQIEQAIALRPNPAETLFPLSIIYVEKGEFDKAIQEFHKMGNSPHGLGHLGNAYARAGRKAEARTILPKLREHVDKSGIGRYEIALIYAGLKNSDQAFEWLERAYQVRDKGLTYMMVDPCLDPLRSDPRFQTLIQRVGFPTI